MTDYEIQKIRDTAFCSGYNTKIKEAEQEKCKLLGIIQGKDKIIKEQEQQISILLSCKECPDNKGGYICEKEYNNKCLSQKIQYIKELQEENRTAKEIIQEFMRISVASVEEYEPEFTELIGKAEQFVSEVDK